MTVAIVTQARIGSSRLPAKVLKKIGALTILEIQLRRAKRSKLATHFFVATTQEEDANKIVELAAASGWDTFQGDLNDVLTRYYFCVKDLKPDYVVRITSDCPLVDPALIDQTISFAIEKNLDYASVGLVESFPDGVDTEVFKFSALEHAYQSSNLLSEREHVTPHIWKNSTFLGGQLFKSDNVHSGGSFKDVRITVDTEADFQVIEKLVGLLGYDRGWREYADLYLKDPDIHGLNSQIIRNEGYQKSLKNDKKI